MKKINIFTDGAARGNPGPGGWGAVIILEQNDSRELKVKSGKHAPLRSEASASGSKVFELGGGEKNTTNNRMELTAAIEALAYLKPTTNNRQQIRIYTDSNYLINGITKWIYSWEKRNWITKNKDPVLNKDLWEKLLELAKFKNIEWEYVAGHSGIFGNEKADKIATAFADGKTPKLNLGVRLPWELDSQVMEGGLKNRPYSYVSLVGGVIKTHKTWAECEKRVKGKSGAKFKKVFSKEEEGKIIKSWKDHIKHL